MANPSPPSKECHGFARITDAPLSSATGMEMKSAAPRQLPYFYSPPERWTKTRGECENNKESQLGYQSILFQIQLAHDRGKLSPSRVGL